MPSLLEARNLIKHYREVKAVNGISFTIPRGTCFGLLGPNGAGKTTTVEMLEGILSPTDGEILYQGRPLGTEFKEEAGIMFQTTALQEQITVQDILNLFQRLYIRARPLSELIKQCALGEFLDREAKRLSGGQRQRLLLAIALINDPRILFLDEPTTGLDPQSRRNFWQLVNNIKAEGKTVILTTHYMEEAYELCDEIVILDHGHIIAQGSPQELLKRHFDQSVLSLPVTDIPSIPELEGKLPLHQRNGKIEIFSDDVDSAIRRLMENGISLNRLQIRSPTLEDLFLELTGHELRG